MGTEKEDKDADCCTNRPNTFNAGSEQHCANTGPERSHTKTTATQTAMQRHAVIQI